MVGQRCILVTGFEKFGKQKCNASWEAVQKLDGFEVGDAKVIVSEIPVVYYESTAAVVKALEDKTITDVILVGEAGGSDQVRIELLGTNYNNDGAKDNNGRDMGGDLTVKDGPAAYFSTIPVKKIVKQLKETHLPAELSLSAGSYLCNHTLYGVLHHLESHASRVRAGFVHVPFTLAQGAESGCAGVSVEQLQATLECIVECVVLN